MLFLLLFYFDISKIEYVIYIFFYKFHGYGNRIFQKLRQPTQIFDVAHRIWRPMAKMWNGINSQKTEQAINALTHIITCCSKRARARVCWCQYEQQCQVCESLPWLCVTDYWLLSARMSWLMCTQRGMQVYVSKMSYPISKIEQQQSTKLTTVSINKFQWAQLIISTADGAGC